MCLLDRSQINNILEILPSLKVLVIGDCMLDHYIWGDVSRISPEAPVPVVAIDHDTYRLGGACNVALNLKQLGCQVSLMGPMGRDAAGETMKNLLTDAGVDVHAFNFRENLNSIIKTRVVVRKQQLCRLDRESFYTEEQVEYIYEQLEALVANVNAVVVSDYNKGSVTQTLLNRLVTLKASHDFLLALDPKPTHELDYSGVDLLKPNREEALKLSGLVFRPHEKFSVNKVAKCILEKYSVKYLAITLGEDGLALLDANGNGEISPTQAREVFDVSGAGDTSLVALTLALCAKMPLITAACFANVAAGVVVGKLGTASVTPQELLDYVQ